MKVFYEVNKLLGIGKFMAIKISQLYVEESNLHMNFRNKDTFPLCIHLKTQSGFDTVRATLFSL